MPAGWLLRLHWAYPSVSLDKNIRNIGKNVDKSILSWRLCKCKLPFVCYTYKIQGSERGMDILAWSYVALAAVVEIFWVVGLRYSDSTLEWTGTAAAIVFSFYFIIKACERLPSGTVYAVFTGSGAAAILLVDIFVFHADFTWVTLAFISLIVIGVVGIKLTTDEQPAEDELHDERGH